MPTTLRASLTNKLTQVDQKYDLKLIKDYVDVEDLGNQVATVFEKDNVIKQYLQKFDPRNKQSQQQFPEIKKKLNQILPDKRNNILIEKILQQSLNKQKQRQTAAFQGAASMFAGAQKKAAQQQSQKRKAAALQGAASMFARAQKKAIPGPKFQPTGQLVDVFKLAEEKKDLVPGQKFKNIAQNITQVKKKARLTPSSSLQEPDAFQRQFGSTQFPKTKKKLTPSSSLQEPDAFQRQFG